MTVVTVCSSTVLLATRPVGADTVSSARAKAAAIEATLASAQAKMSALSQQYDAAKTRLDQINSNIATTKANIATDHAQVSSDKKTLAKAAVASYVSNGSATADNPIFSSNEKTMNAANEYNQIAEGDINLAVANLHTAENTLSAQESQLASQQNQAQQQVAAENAAIAANQQEVTAQSAALAQENGEVANLVHQQQLAAVAASQRVTTARLASATTRSSYAGLSQAAPPPTAAGGQGAVQAAESQLGVPYVWGGESPKGSGHPGFDCSGLTAWSWGQVGVGLPHYSGAQMGDSAPVPLSDLQPGDLLFYGPGGSEHVAMYVGPGTMIEAPDSGNVVHLTALRLGGGFVGAGRP